jgi:hypothetical protein
VVEEPAHAAAAAVMAFMAVEAERVAAVSAPMAALATGMVVEMTSKHVVLDPVSLYQSYRYIGLGSRQERI